MRHRRLDETERLKRVEHITRLYKMGYTLVVIAASVGVCVGTVSGELKRAGVLRTRGKSSISAVSHRHC